MPGKTSKNSILYSRFLIGKVRQILYTARQKELAAYYVSPKQAHVLTLIDSLGDQAYLITLAERTERNINTLSVQMTRMENDGLVKKIRDIPKSNKVRFELTEKGYRIYRDARKIKSARIIMSSLSEEERQQLISLLEKVVDKTEKYY